MLNENKCSVLINSCDKYEDAWYPFFELLKMHWKECPYPIYLNTEKKQYVHDDMNIKVLNCLETSPNEEVSWGKRIKDCLLKIQTPYVILLLEDFFLQEKVDTSELTACLKMMDDIPELAAIYFKQISGFRDDFEGNSQYYRMNENKIYRLNLQAGLWRREALIDLIMGTDTPWSFEDGQERLGDKEYLFLCSKKGTHSKTENCVFPYLTARKTGYGIWKGKWLWKNEKMFRRFGISVPEVKMERFSQIDMVQYYIRRLRQELCKK